MNISGMAIILQMRERMEEMQRQIQEFVQYIQQEVLYPRQCRRRSSRGAIVPVRRRPCRRPRRRQKEVAGRELTTTYTELRFPLCYPAPLW